MGPPAQRFETLAHAQVQESGEENITPLPTRSQLLRRKTGGAGDAQWRVFNLLSLGFSASILLIGPS